MESQDSMAMLSQFITYAQQELLCAFNYLATLQSVSLLMPND